MDNNNAESIPTKDNESLVKKFYKVIKDNFDDFLSSKGFEFRSEVVDQYFFDRSYRKGSQYIKITASIHPQDIPYFWNILLGEGSSEMPESDWNTIVLWRLMRHLGKSSAREFSLVDKKTDELMEDVRSAKNDLERFGKSFLDGDLSIFYEVRSSVNQDRALYQKSTVEDDGSFKVVDDEEAKKLKEKFIKN